MVVDGQHYMTEKEVASHYGLPVSWVQKARYSRDNFPYYRLRGRVFFKKEEINKWFKENLKPQ